MKKKRESLPPMSGMTGAQKIALGARLIWHRIGKGSPDCKLFAICAIRLQTFY